MGQNANVNKGRRTDKFDAGHLGSERSRYGVIGFSFGRLEGRQATVLMDIAALQSCLPSRGLYERCHFLTTARICGEALRDSVRTARAVPTCPIRRCRENIAPFPQAPGGVGSSVMQSCPSEPLIAYPPGA